VEKSANGGDGIITTTRDLGDHYDIYIYSEKGSRNDKAICFGAYRSGVVLMILCPLGDALPSSVFAQHASI
jgi:hypothetical protein